MPAPLAASLPHPIGVKAIAAATAAATKELSEEVFWVHLRHRPAVKFISRPHATLSEKRSCTAKG